MFASVGLILFGKSPDPCRDSFYLFNPLSKEVCLRRNIDRSLSEQSNVCFSNQPLMGWTRRAPAPPSRKGGTGLPTAGTSHATQDHQPPVAVPTIGIDIGKNTFHLIGLDKMGAIVLRQKLSRMPPCR